ncbi:hypothetical protein B566_EDAN010877 [Ephemera danica]|nr:hypothetical protein B566_EDAN010877 [Ephemera danica]
MFRRDIRMWRALIFLIASAVAAPATSGLQDELDGLVSRLRQGGNQTTENTGGVLLLPSTFSVDMWSLLRLAVKQEVKTELEQVRERTSFTDNNQQRIYRNWMDALTFCRMYGMDLVSVETKEENDLIVGYLDSIGLKHDNVVHISANKIGRSTYMWLNGEPVVYANWGPDQPAHFAVRNCVGYHATPWQWIDYPCTGYERYVMCEQP